MLPANPTLALRERWESPEGLSAWGAVLAAIARGDDWREVLGELPGHPRLDPSQGDLRGIDLTGADLRGVDLSFARLDSALLDGAQLDGACLRHAVVSGATLQAATARRADLSGLVALATNLGRADLQEADLSSANLARARLVQANLLGASLKYASLAGADLSGADLRGAHLFAADLGGTRFVRVRTDADRWRRPTFAAAHGGFPSLASAVGRYEPLLHLASPGDVVDVIEDRLSRSREAAREVAALLEASDWRSQLVGAVAALLCPADPWLDERLWSALERDSWVSPQLAAATWYRDPFFVARAAPLLADPLGAPKRAGALAAVCRASAFVEPLVRSSVERVEALVGRPEPAAAIGDFTPAVWAALGFGHRHAVVWASRVWWRVPPAARQAWVRREPPGGRGGPPSSA